MYDNLRYEMKVDGESADIDVYGVIGGFFGDVTAQSFRSDLKNAGNVKQINLHVHSPGGNVFEGMAMYEMLRSHPAKVITYVDGLAASMGSVLMFAGEERHIVENGWVMIHNPSATVHGTAKDLRKSAEVAQKMQDKFINLYESNTSLTKEEIEQYMEDEAMFSAEEALEHGFATHIDGESEVDIAAYTGISTEKAPQALLTMVMSAAEKSNKKEPGENPKENERDIDMNITMELLKADYADLVDQIKSEGVEAALKSGAETERQRIQGVLEQSVAGCEEMVQEMAFDGKTTGPEAAVKVLAQLKVVGEAKLNELESESNEPAGTSHEEPAPAKTDEPITMETQITDAWNANPELHASFIDFDGYKALCLRENQIITQ